MSDLSDITYHYYDAEPGTLLAEGATEGWLYLWEGVPGPARAVKVVAITDPDGHGFMEQVGEWQDVMIVDDDEMRP